MKLREVAAYLGVRVLNGILAFVTLALLTTWLDPEAYGRYALGMAVIGAGSAIGFQWLATASNRFYAAHQQAPAELIGTTARLWLGLGLLIPLLALAAWRLGLLPADSWMTALLLGCAVAMMGLFNILLQFANARAQPAQYGRMTLIRSVGILALAAWLIHGLQAAWPAEQLLWLAVLAATTLACCFSGTRRPAGGLLWSSSVAGTLTRYGLPQAGSFVALMVLDLSDRFFIGLWHGARAVGGYAAGYDLTQQTIGVLLNVLYLAAFPHLVRLHEQKQTSQTQELLQRHAQTMLLVATCASSFFATMAPDLARIIRNPELAGEASRLMPVIASAIALAGLKAYALDVVFQLHQRTRDTLLITLIMAIANVLLNLGFVPHYGASAAAWSALASFGLGAAISYYWGRRHWDMPALGGSAAKALMVAAGGAVAGLAARGSTTSADWPLPAIAAASLLAWSLSVLALALACNAAGARDLVRRLVLKRH